MQNVKRLRAVQRANPRHVERLAWLVLLVAFGLFCSVTIASGYLFLRYRAQAMETHTSALIARAPTEWISWKRKDRIAFERPVEGIEQTVMPEGSEVRIDRSAGYGQAATIRLFDESTLDLWPGADLRLETVQTSRWNNRTQQVILHQYDGYVRYDLRDDQLYEHVNYRVVIGETTVELAPGGSYSIEIVPSDRRVHLADTTLPAPSFIDVAVRSGIAEVHGRGRTVRLAAGQRVEVDPTGLPSLPVPARWELIRDGSFNQYSEEEYNNTTITDQPALPRARTWQVRSNPADPEATPNGFFTIARGCPPPDPTTDCDPRTWRNAAGFMRTGGQTKSFITGVRQLLGPKQEGVDISEYRSLVFSAWVRVLYQSIDLAGERGTECPIMIRFMAKRNHPSDPEEYRFVCVYSSKESGQQPVRDPNVAYYRVAPFEWYHLQIELRDEAWLPDFRYLRYIDIYANGHDYNSRVTEVSLIGSHTRPIASDEAHVGE